MSCTDWGSDITLETNTIGEENPSYTGGGFDNVLDDPNATGSWYAWDAGYKTTGWTGQDFGLGSEKNVGKYRIYSDDGTYAPKTWTFQASVTGAWSGEEVTLHSVTDYSFDASPAWHEWVFSNSNSYRYYRIDVTANNGGATYLVVREIEMYECQWAGYFSGYVFEEGNPVVRTLYLHHRLDGELVATTTSSGNGYYYMETTYSGSHYIICLDDVVGEDYNDLILGNMTPMTVSW